MTSGPTETTHPDDLDAAFQDGLLDGVRGSEKDYDGCTEFGMGEAYDQGYAEGKAVRERRALSS